MRDFHRRQEQGSYTRQKKIQIGYCNVTFLWRLEVICKVGLTSGDQVIPDFLV